MKGFIQDQEFMSWTGKAERRLEWWICGHFASSGRQVAYLGSIINRTVDGEAGLLAAMIYDSGTL